jgi:hypothetical protein
MLTKSNLGRIGGVIATLSLLFLPLASCGDAQLTGIEVFSAENSEVHKVLLAVALIAAIAAIFVVTRVAQIAACVVGIVVIALEYFNSVQDPERLVQLREGAYLALLGFGLVLAAGLMDPGFAPPAKRKRS